MKNKLKSLLALALSVLIGHTWAAEATLDTDVSKAIRQALDVSDGKSVSIAMRLSFKEAAANLETDATFASLTIDTIGDVANIKSQGYGAHLHAYSANHGIGGNVGNGGSGTWFENREPVGTGSHVVVFVVSPEGSDEDKVTLTSYADGKVLKRGTQSTFANYSPTEGKVYFNTAINDTLWTYESVTYFEKALTAEEVKNLSLFMGRGETISLNFASGKTNGSVVDGTVSGLVSAKGWMNLAGESGSGETVTICDGESLISEFSVAYSYESATTWSWDAGNTNNCNYINGYLDDGTHNGVNGPTINVSKIPFSQYSIIVYTATDTARGAFRPVSINGISYKGSSELTSVGYAVASTDNWGASQTTSVVYGTNALRVDGLSGNLTVQGGGKSGNNRGCIAAIQIVNTGVIFDANGQQAIDWSENEAPKTSELPELLKYNVELTLSDGATLVVDSVDAIKDLHKIYIKSSGSVTVQVTDITVGSTELGLVFDTQNVEGGVTYTYDYTEELGYTKDGMTYPLIFRGTTDANWATLSNWYIGTRTQGETTYWIPYTGNIAPGLAGSSEWRTTLLDGKLMNVTAGDDDYKTITTPTNPKYEGWSPKITVCNGVHVKIGQMKKMQSNTESGPSNIIVDDTSKITVTTFDAESACDGEHKFYVNAKDGVNFSCPDQEGKRFKPSVSYYFDDDGSVNLGYVSGSQTVKEVKLDLGDSNLQGKTIVSRKLIGFGGTATCSYEEAGVSSTSGVEVAPLAEGSALEDAEVGTYQFSVEEDGYYVNYVAYAPVAKVNVTIPAAPANTKWFMGETEVSGTIAVDPNTDVTLTLKADEGYVFADGSTSTTVTVNAGETGATVETPDVTAEPVSNIVAKIGDTEYETLQAAVNAAGENATVELFADTTENITVPAGFTGTIDLGGNTLTGNVQAAYDAATTTDFILQNGYIITPAGNTSKGAIFIKYAAVELIDIDLTANYHGIRTEVGGNVTINGGRYEAICKPNTQYNVVYAKEDSTITIEDGTFICTPNGGAVYCINPNAAASEIYVNGGSFTTIGSVYLVDMTAKGTCAISGGLFSVAAKNDVNQKLASGYIGDDTINPGYYTVAKAYNVAKTIDTTKVTVAGLKDAYACGGKASFTVAAIEGNTVTGVTLDGEVLIADENGNYTFTMPEKDVAIVVTTESTSTFDVMINGQPVADADALKLAANSTTTMTVPETSTWTADGNVLKKDGEAYVTFADYYTVVVNGTSVALKLNKPVIGDSAEGADDAFTVTADAVTIKITNYNSVLKYGVRIAADINSLSSAEITVLSVANGNITEDGVITLEKSGDSAFYEVVVSDVEIPTTPAE